MTNHILTPLDIEKLDWRDIRALKMSAEAERDLWGRVADLHNEGIQKVIDRLEKWAPGFVKEAVLVHDQSALRSGFVFPDGLRVIIETRSFTHQDKVTFSTECRVKELKEDPEATALLWRKNITCFWASIPTDRVEGHAPPNDFNYH